MDVPTTPPTEFPLKKPGTPWERLRRHFIAGFLVIVPLAVAVYATLVIMGAADWMFGDLVEQILSEIGIPAEYLPKRFISFLIACVFVLLVGWLSTFFAIKRLIIVGERIISRVPLVKFFYSVPKEVLNTFAVSKKDSYKRVVLVEYPRHGMWAVAFVTGELIKKPDGMILVSVFIPTTPNPTSGFLLYLPHDEVLDTNLPVEEAARLIISGGILAPPNIHTQKFCGLGTWPDLPPLSPIMVEPEIYTTSPEEASAPPSALPREKGEH